MRPGFISVQLDSKAWVGGKSSVFLIPLACLQSFRPGGGCGSRPEAAPPVLPGPGEVPQLADGGGDHLQCFNRCHQQGEAAGSAWGGQEAAGPVEGRTRFNTHILFIKACNPARLRCNCMAWLFTRDRKCWTLTGSSENLKQISLISPAITVLVWFVPPSLTRYQWNRIIHVSHSTCQPSLSDDWFPYVSSLAESGYECNRFPVFIYKNWPYINNGGALSFGAVWAESKLFSQGQHGIRAERV